MLAIRLARIGAKKKPSYRVVVINKRNARDGKSVEIVGHYNPTRDPIELSLESERIDHWLGQGAQASVTVKRLIAYKEKGGPTWEPGTKTSTRGSAPAKAAKTEEIAAEAAKETATEEAAATEAPAAEPEKAPEAAAGEAPAAEAEKTQEAAPAEAPAAEAEKTPEAAPAEVPAVEAEETPKAEEAAESAASEEAKPAADG